MSPVTGVVIPVYNGAAYIEEALGSVFSQSLAPHEVVVVDDGSTDETEAILERVVDERLRVVRQENAGPAAARNRGLAEGRSDLVAFLDADDLWEPKKLELQVALLAAHPDIDVVMGMTEGIDLGDYEPKAGAFRSSWEARHFLQLGAALFRRSAFAQVGPFDESLRFGEDLDWFLRAAEASVLVHTHSEKVLRYRRHAHNMTNDTKSRDRGFMQALHKTIQRRRAGR